MSANFRDGKVYKYGERYSGTKTRCGNVQDYEVLRSIYLKRKELFEDPEFPCTEQNVFGEKEPEFNLEWKRPYELCDNPEFLTEGFSRFDVEQGCLGNCWMVASVSALAMHEELFKNVVPDDQSFTDGEYAGIFHFRLWKANRWVDVVVDDQLPFDADSGWLAFMRSSTTHEFWSALLEKAYAKLHGGYAALIGGSGAEAMQVLTGGLSESIYLNEFQDDLFGTVRQALEKYSLLTCYTPDDFEEYRGILGNHAYTITGAEKVPVDGAEVKLFRVRNPWGCREWEGPWSDGSSEWDAIDEQQLRESGHLAKDDGEFWMSEEHFMECFSGVEFCHLDPGSMPSAVEEGFSEKCWSVVKHEGAWVPGLSAGGSPDSEAYATNPQYIVTLDEEDDQGDGCRIIVALLQKGRRWFQSREDMWLPINFHVYEIEDTGSSSRRLTAEDFENSQLVGCCDAYYPSREVMRRLHLYPGTFCVVPSTYEADEAGDFLLRIYTEKESTCGKCSEKPLKMQFFEGCSGGYVSDDDMKAAFDELASADGTISIKSLQKLLNKLSELGNQPVEFSMEFCRIMMACCDEDRTGSIDFHEFKRLHQTTDVLRLAFNMKLDPDSSGSVSLEKLRNFADTGDVDLDTVLMKILAWRFGSEERMEFMDFITFRLRLEYMISIYNGFIANMAKPVPLSLSKFIALTMVI